MGFDADEAILKRMYADAEIPASGCCGLAGSWGFEREKFDISMACGERVLFPAVRRAERSTVILADGFSCRTQIEQGTQRRAIHLAQLIRQAISDRAPLPADFPERAFEPPSAARVTAARGTALAIGAGGLVAGGVQLRRRIRAR
jgi:hypothetical protein